MSEGAPVLFLMGPTAAGKTDLAVALARGLPLEIVSVDSAMVYRGMNIGTGKPPPEVLARTPHRLVDIRDPHEAYSAAAFRRDALAEIARIRRDGRAPLLVGGTRLYFLAVRDGLSPLPSADPPIRARLEREAATLGWGALHERLASVDPAAADRIHPNDPQRIQRALEVHELRGRPMSELIAESVGHQPALPVRAIVIEPSDRARLHARIAARFREMVRAGLVDEVRALRRDRRLHRDLPSMRAVGYRQAWDHLEGKLDAAGFADKAVAATRQLARRQLTWLRAERDAVRFDCFDERLEVRVRGWIEGALEAGAGP